MNFEAARHVQRYEYIAKKGYVINKPVIDFGCGPCGYGSRILTSTALFVYAVDSEMMVGGPTPVYVEHSAGFRPERIQYVKKDIYDIDVSGVSDCVGVAVEVFEHMEDPVKFIDHLAKLCTDVFITTPLASTTGPTRNPKHVAEYSRKDFLKIVGKGFKVLEYACQMSDMRIVRRATPRGDSMNGSHVVQMVWCKRKEKL
jgi:2-polyprenyl-3-methyl-5-hydroxy-6-metoxy-1,4-benzoquinol methylase